MGKKEIEIPDISFEEINLIVDKGVRKRKTFMRFLKDSIKELGFRNIFHDRTELFIIFLIGAAMILTCMSNFKSSNISEMYEFTFIISPIMYLSAVLFSFYNSKEKGAFDIEMTCKYNLYQLSALRMFIFSIASIILNTVLIIALWTMGRDIDVLRMIVISITGLFLFSTIFLYALLKLKHNISKYFIIALWIIINLFFRKYITDGYKEFLFNAPLYIHLLISIICIFFYIKNLNKLINYRRKKGEIKC